MIYTKLAPACRKGLKNHLFLLIDIACCLCSKASANPGWAFPEGLAPVRPPDVTQENREPKTVRTTAAR